MSRLLKRRLLYHLLLLLFLNQLPLTPMRPVLALQGRAKPTSAMQHIESEDKEKSNKRKSTATSSQPTKRPRRSLQQLVHAYFPDLPESYTFPTHLRDLHFYTATAESDEEMNDPRPASPSSSPPKEQPTPTSIPISTSPPSPSPLPSSTSAASRPFFAQTNCFHSLTSYPRSSLLRL